MVDLINDIADIDLKISENTAELEKLEKKHLTCRHYEIVCDVDKLNVDLQATFMKYKTIKQWAYIIHDKDDTRPHYHIYINFGNSCVSSDMVAKWFDVPENFVGKVKGRKTDVLAYLTHSNESQQHKHQYQPTDVVANFDFVSEIEQSKIIGNFEHYSYAQQLTYINTLPITEKTVAFSKLKRLWEIECQNSILNTERNIEVVFISGKGGTGKTYYAKKLLSQLNYDICISSSSNDPFQDYLGQKGMILDDLRDKSFELDDLLKILDNNTNSSVKSRFNNKVFNGKMIIITSSVPLRYWYPNYKFNANDNLYQLYRRIGCYVTINEKDILLYEDGVDDEGKPKGKVTVFNNDLLLNVVKKEKSKTDFKSAFEQIKVGV